MDVKSLKFNSYNVGIRSIEGIQLGFLATANGSNKGNSEINLNNHIMEFDS